MTLIPLTDSGEIQEAFGKLAENVKQGSERFTKHIGWQGGGGEFEIYWHGDPGIWCVLEADSEPNRYWCAFGTDNPRESNSLDIVCEINPPKSGVNRQVAGVFLRDESGAVYLGHSGKVGGGRPGIGQAAFLDFYGDNNRAPVLWPNGQESESIVVGRIDTPDLLAKVKDFVDTVKKFKNEAAGQSAPKSVDAKSGFTADSSAALPSRRGVSMLNDNDFIFLISDQGNFTKAPGRPYETEDDLQEIVAAHPDVLLAGDPSEDEPIRWLLVDREVSIPDAGADRWAIDHVFIDTHGVPTLVEVKRSSDTRIRREVVGQMLEYAANGRKYWPVGRLRALAEEQAKQPDGMSIEDFLGPHEVGADRIEAFWQTVEENLRTGHLRLLFVADRLPSELRAIIEFLNEKMDGVEVLGVELRQYTAEGLRALVPRIVGQTEAARLRKRPRSGPPLTEDTFLEMCPDLARGFFEWVLRESSKYGMTARWATKSFSLGGPAADGVFYGWMDATVQVYVKGLGNTVACEAVRQRVLDLGRFRASGKYTAELKLSDEGTVEIARKALGACRE